MTLVCEQCLKPFEARRSTRKFCTISCSTKHRVANTPRTVRRTIIAGSSNDWAFTRDDIARARGWVST